MNQGFLHNLIYCTAIWLLSVGSLLSVVAMSPEKSDAMRAEIAAMGVPDSEFCGDSGSGHDHSCPFCTLLPEAEVPSLPSMALPLMPYSLWQRSDDLHRAAQARDHARSPRAPPALI